MRFLRTIGQKGSLTLPSEIRQVLDVQEGDILEFEVVGVVRRAEKVEVSA
ncbi:MAG TPA: AbrB/MazE/SpoVT family DNA-binding domain-containing protein [Candidatus Thermoplasmatota archaeon]|nr:AbrB/MazE/SpoVT family DNA-binding domain-containing protein [Candidatus Thermoplasmatota archaeon]